jgi:hypothetical protein
MPGRLAVKVPDGTDALLSAPTVPAQARNAVYHRLVKAPANAPGVVRADGPSEGMRSASLVMVEIEAVSVEVLGGELPQPPRLLFQGLNNVRARRFQGPNLFARIEPANLKAERIPIVPLRALNISNGQFWHWLANRRQGPFRAHEALLHASNALMGASITPAFLSQTHLRGNNPFCNMHLRT